MRQACARPSREPGQDIGQRARQDHVMEQAPAVRAHGLRGAHPDFLDRLHPGPGVEDDRKSGDESDQQHGGLVAEPEPEQEQRRIGEARDRRADAHQREEDVFRPARAPHGQPDRHAGHRGKREAGERDG